MSSATTPQGGPAPVAPPRAFKTLLRLTGLYGACALAAGLSPLVLLLPADMLRGAHALASETVKGGEGALVESALLLALTALAAALGLAAARRHGAGAPRRRLLDPGWMARTGQALIVPAGTILIVLAVSLMWPGMSAPAPSPQVSVGLAGSVALALAFISLIGERTLAALPETLLPEAPAVRRMLLVSTVLLTAAGVLELARASALPWLNWIAPALALVPCVIAGELALRAGARLFLPAPPAASATAVSVSLVASALTGGPRSTGEFLRTQFGLDFARSWALAFVRAAAVSALAGTALFCWALSGVKLIDLGQRGVYERLGAPVAVLGPGLHVLLPWPLGVLRPVELGAIHAVAIGVDQGGEETGPAVAAEAPAPLALNRLWESTHAGQASYLVPSPSTGAQGFQSVSTEISVLYRVGLTDRQALDSVYTVAQPQDLVRQAASRLVLRYFNSRTLESVLGASRETISDSLRRELATDLDGYRAGIDVVAVLIEEIHPPAGAAAAYHAVQAAQINATASISDELGRAKRAAGTAQQEAHQLVSAAQAAAAESVQTATGEAERFAADRAAHAAGGRAFLMERSFSNLTRALGAGPLTIVDHRLSPGQAPVIDLRGPAPQSPGAAPPATPLPLPPGTLGPPPAKPGANPANSPDSADTID